MKSEFALAFNQICAEYSLPREVVLDAVRAALVTAYRRDWKVAPTQNVTAEINFDTGLARIYVEKLVVDTIEDVDSQITLPLARRIKSTAQVGDLILIDETPHNFGRIAAQTAKQVITQRLREAERESQFNRFSRQEGEIIIGTIQSIKPHGITLHLERREEAHMPKREQIPGEHYTLHQKIRVYVLEVRRTPRGPEIIASRSHPRMLRRLLELEVPEIRGGQVEIQAIAREAGSRAKVAVSTRQSGLDPVGACVGMRGIRIQTISRELHGERIDVIEWSQDPIAYIANALSMHQVLNVILDENNPGGRTAYVVVMDDQLSLAIGRAGQNARLAAKLTNWRIDIEGATAAALWALEQINESPELLGNLKSVASLFPKLASIMRVHESDHYPYTDEERRIIHTVVSAVRQVQIDLRNAERPGARQARARRTAQQHAEEARLEAMVKARSTVPQAAYAISVEQLELAEKVLQHLKSNELINVGQLMERIALGDEAVLMLQGVGTKALRQIKDAVQDLGLTFAIDEADFAVEPMVPSEMPPEVTTLEATQAEELLEVDSEAIIAEEEEVVVVAADEVIPELIEIDTLLTPEAEPELSEAVGVASVEEEVEVSSVEEEILEVSEQEIEVSPESQEDAVFPFEVTPISSLGEYEFEEDEDFDDDLSSKKKGKRRKKGRTLVFDEETGQTRIMRKRRRSDRWEGYDDF
ncbi:MAG: transcription termination/antitermination protein NusA [Anaerolineae bacterium]|nr:transcription termination/antitermination protein NusA [Anaerolineae bacterium]